jgi:DNA-binding CsgD family transcriptional regulator
VKSEGGRARLSEKSARVLRMIADGRSYAQIVDANADLTYHDIFLAAEEALELSELTSANGADGRLSEIRKQFPRAYEPWGAPEEEQLRALHDAGDSIKEIAAQLQRQPSAVESRLRRLGLVE